MATFKKWRNRNTEWTSLVRMLTPQMLSIFAHERSSGVGEKHGRAHSASSRGEMWGWPSMVGFSTTKKVFSPWENISRSLAYSALRVLVLPLVPLAHASLTPSSPRRGGSVRPTAAPLRMVLNQLFFWRQQWRLNHQNLGFNMVYTSWYIHIYICIYTCIHM